MSTTFIALLLAFLCPTQNPPASPPAAPAQSARALLLRGATVHSMRPGEAPSVQDVLVVDGHIRALGAAAASESDPEVLELSGKHLVPGLIDALVNYDPNHDALYLAAGITLVRDLGGDHSLLQRERAPARRERVPGPELLSAGAVLDGDPPASAQAVVLRTPDSAEAYIPILLEENVDFLSILPGLPEDVWRKTIQIAHENERGVFGPRPPRIALADALLAGQDGFHALDSLLPPGVFWGQATPEQMTASVSALAASGKPLVPLLHASALRLSDQELDPAARALFALLDQSYEAWWRGELALRREFLTPERRAPGEALVAQQERALRALFDAGARLLPGSGAPQPWLFPGTALHQELAAWVRVGIPPAAVLEAATRGAAELLGQAGKRGTIEPGAIADLLVIDGDPLEDLGRLLTPAWVVVRGRALSRAQIEQRLAAVAEAQAAVRKELALAVEVAEPPQAEEGSVLLEGTVETTSFGSRVSTERYRVVRISSDTTLYTSRVVFAPSAGSAAREMTLEQFVRGGRLEQVHATLREGEKLLTHDGLWTANSWRMQTRFDGRLVNSPAALREHPVCVESSSVTALLILGQADVGEGLPVVQLHPGFDAEAVRWRYEFDGEGNHRVRTQLGYKVFRLDEHGALEAAVTKVGPGLVETRSLSSTAFGGAGLPLPAAKRAAAPAPAKPGG